MALAAVLMNTSTSARDDGFDDSAYRVKGHVAAGKLEEYERGKIEWDALIKDYQSYGFTLPAKGSQLVRFPREIWSAEGPMQLWHLGFVLPPEGNKKKNSPMRLLVGAEIFWRNVPGEPG